MAGLFDNQYQSALAPTGMQGYVNYQGAETAASTPTLGNTTGSGYTPPAGDWWGQLKDLFSGALDKTDATSNITQHGYAAPLIGGASALMNGFLGMQQYGLAKDTLQMQKDQFSANYNNQRSLTNTQLNDRQTARVAAGAPGAYQSVSSYMAQNGIK